MIDPQLLLACDVKDANGLFSFAMRELACLYLTGNVNQFFY